MWRNTQNAYGLVSIALHWLVATITIGLFALGLWMVDLGYYDAWYQRAPDLHRSFGFALLAIMLVRTVWRLVNSGPTPLGSTFERRAGRLVHGLLYTLLFILIASGYLISTADGRAIDVFGIMEIPAIISGLDKQEDIAGSVHEILSYVLITLAMLHALAALFHHFFHRDKTLMRMLKFNP